MAKNSSRTIYVSIRDSKVRVSYKHISISILGSEFSAGNKRKENGFQP